jgi:arylformamidase
MSRIIDISLPIAAGGVVYPGNPEIRVEAQQAIARGDGANVSRLDFGSHTGTHVDAAKHFFDDGQTVDAMPLDRMMGPAIVLEFGNDVRAIGERELRGAGLRGHTRVLLKTRNSRLLDRAEFVRDYTYLDGDGADWLVSQGVVCVGIDYFSVEQFHSGHHRAHRALLGAEVAIIEGLYLASVAAGEYELVCLPLRIAGIDGAPARAVLIDRGGARQ